MERFWKKVEKTPGCWIWLGGTSGDGYGRFWLDGSKLAHRIAYELEIGEIPEGLALDHICRFRGCVNPAHLEPVTTLENIQRGVEYGTVGYNKFKTHCKNGHPFTDENTGDWGGKRYCRICRRKWDKEGRERRKKGIKLSPGRPRATP